MIPSISRLSGRLGIAAFSFMIFGLAACSQDQSQASRSEHRDYERGDTLTVVGTLVDTRCFAINKTNVTDDHTLPEGNIPGCGTACAMQGIPVAVLEGGKASGKPWILVSYPSQIFAEYIATTIRVIGQYGADGILVPIHVDTETDEGWARIL